MTSPRDYSEERSISLRPLKFPHYCEEEEDEEEEDEELVS